MINISEKTIRLSIKDCIGIFIFLLTICIAVGGVNKEVSALEETTDKIDTVSKEIYNLNMKLDRIITDRSNHRLTPR